MKNIQLIEEVKRFTLLSKYNTNNTLNENLNIVYEQRGSLKNLIRGLSSSGKRTLLGELDDLLRGVTTKKLVVRDISNTRLNVADDILKAIEKGRLAPAELGKVNAGLFKTTKNNALKRAIAEDISSSVTFAKKYGSKTEYEARALLKSKNYTDDEVKLLIDSYKKSGNKFGKISTTGGSSTTSYVKPPKTKPPRTRRRQSAHSVFKTKPKTDKSLMSKALSLVKGVLLGKAFLILLGIGLAAWGIYEWFLSEDDTGFPDCLKLMIPADDWEKMVDEKLDYVLISETGVPEIDDEGGGKFFQDKKFESVNGKLSGTWDYDFDGGVSVDVNGITLELPCDGLNLTPEDVTDVTQEIVYGPCTTFPLVIGCENNILIDIKKCLGFTDLSNKFDEQLKLALVRAGYGETLTEDIYNRILEICRDTEIMKDFKGIRSVSSNLEDI